MYNRANKAVVARGSVGLSRPIPSSIRSATRSLSFRLSSAKCREETYLGESHLVVPVIPLVGNIVFWPTGAEGYEWVPDYVIAAAPVGWNNRPVVPIHPDISLPTANTPEFLTAYCFGQLFNTYYGADDKLHTEAWLNRTRAAQVGTMATGVLAKCESGEMVEVSVGAQIQFEKRAGSFNGQSYVGIWRGLVPDHLAVGLNGSEGACSIEAGCGGPRTAVTKIKPVKPTDKSDRPRSRSKSKYVFLESNRSRLIGATTMPMPSLRESVTGLLTALRLSGTPAEDAEEAAELIAYGSMRDLVDNAIAKLQAARVDIVSLISAETESPTESVEAESAEETIELAQYSRIRTLLYSAGDEIYAASSVVYDLYREHVADKLEEEAAADGATPVVIVGDTRYYADGSGGDGARSAAGARHSKEDMKMIQSTHDTTVKLGAVCVSEETKAAAATATATTVKPCGCHNPASLF